MVETFQRPFEMCVKEGDVASVMCSFNEIDGIPACADRNLLTDTFRGEWNLHGYVLQNKTMSTYFSLSSITLKR